MMALAILPPAAFDEAISEPTPDRAWTIVCVLGVVASHLYPFVWLAVAS